MDNAGDLLKPKTKMSKIPDGRVTALEGIYIRKRRNDSLVGIALDDRVSDPTGSFPMIYRKGTSLYFWDAAQAWQLNGGGGGGGGVPSFDAIFASDQTMNVAGTTFTIDNSTGNNNVFTLTNSGAGSGHLIQITNVGTGKDINGTSGTWSFSKTGQQVALNAVFAGVAAGTAAITLTAGDLVLSSGQVTITRANDAATLTVTNNSAATASSVAIAGSGTFTGSTTTSFMTITPSGLTTGTALYLPVAAMTTGRAVHIVANAVTSGIVFNVTSSATAITGAGRLFLSTHSGSTGTSAILNEFISAATDETVILQITASGALALGTAVNISGSSITTGNGLTLPNLDALTTGLGVQVASAATAITGAGRLHFVNHTGATTSTGTLVEFKTAATDATNATTLLKLTSAASIVGVNLSIVGTTGMTTGSLIRATSSTAGAIATNGIYSFLGTGNFTNGASTLGMFHVAAASTAAGTIMSILGGSQTTGIALNITDPGTGMTSGSLLRVISASTGAVSTNGIVSFQSSGAFTSTSIGFVNVISSGATAGTAVAIQISAASQTASTALRIDQSGTTTGYTGNVVQITGSSTTGQANTLAVIGVHSTLGNVVSITNAGAAQTGSQLLSVVQSGTTTGYTGSVVQITASSTTGTGNALGIVAVNTVAGDAVKITNNALTLGAGTLLNLVHGTSVIGAGSSMLRITSTGTDTGSTTGTLLDLAATAATTATLVLLTAAAVTSGVGMLFNMNGLTTGQAISVAHTTSVIASGGTLLKLSSTSVDTATTSGSLLTLISTGAQVGTLAFISDVALTTGIGVQITHATSVLASGASLLQITSSSADTGTTHGVLLDLVGSASTAGTQFLQTYAALTTGIGQSIAVNALTTGTGLAISTTTTNAGAWALLKLTGSGAGAVGGVLISGSNLVQASHFQKIATFGGVTIWTSDGTTPNAALTGTAGDICLNGASSRTFYCTGTTNWTASNA